MREDREDGVADLVAPDDLARAQALGDGGADVVGGDDLEHGGAHVAGDRRHGGEAEGEGGHDRGGEGLVAGDRQDRPLHREEVLQQAADDEARDRDADQHEDDGQIVEALAAVEGGDDAEPEAEDDGQRHRAEAEVERDREGGADDVVDPAAALGERIAEVALGEVRHVDEVLLEERLIEAVVGVQARPDLGGDARAGEGVAGDEPHQEEGDRRQNEDRDERDHQATEDVSEHAGLSGGRRRGAAAGRGYHFSMSA